MKKRFCFKEANAIFEAKSLLFKIVTAQDGASSCPAKPNKKHRRFSRRPEYTVTQNKSMGFPHPILISLWRDAHIFVKYTDKAVGGIKTYHGT